MQVSVTYRTGKNIVSRDFKGVTTITSTLASVVLLFGRGDITSFGKESIISLVVSEE